MNRNELSRKMKQFSLFGINASSLKVSSLIGYLPEESLIFEGVSALEFLILIGTCKGLTRTSLLKQIIYLSSLFEISPYYDYYLTQLSPGTLRKLNIVAALLGPPRLIVLDDPFRDIDPYVKRVIIMCLESYVKHRTLTMLFTSRTPETKLSTRVISMQEIWNN